MRPKLLTHQTALLLGVTPDSVRDMARRGVLKAVRVGHVRLFDRDEVVALAERRKARPKPTPSPKTTAIK